MFFFNPFYNVSVKHVFDQLKRKRIKGKNRFRGHMSVGVAMGYSAPRYLLPLNNIMRRNPVSCTHTRDHFESGTYWWLEAFFFLDQITVDVFQALFT